MLGRLGKAGCCFGRNDSTRLVCSRASLGHGNTRAALQTAALARMVIVSPNAKVNRPFMNSGSACLVRVFAIPAAGAALAVQIRFIPILKLLFKFYGSYGSNTPTSKDRWGARKAQHSDRSRARVKIRTENDDVSVCD